MRPGTPGFIGLRLREAREARALTASALARQLRVTKQAVSQYENGVQSPSPEVMKRICDYLNLPDYFFFRQFPPLSKGTIFYRSLSSFTKIARTMAERRYEWLRRSVAFFRESVEFPVVNVPNYDLPSKPQLISNEMVESIASEVRQHWNLAKIPIRNMIKLLEANGVITGQDEFDAEGLDGFSEWAPVEETPYIMLNIDKRSSARSRLNAAHELGHLVLHRKIKPEQFTQKQEHKLIEEQAFRFAGAFLVPAEQFAEEFYAVSLDPLIAMKRKWKVAIGMMIKRAENLDLISREQARKLFVKRTRNGWQVKEPLDDELEIEQPSLLSKAIDLLIREDVVSRDEILWELPYDPTTDIEALLSLTDGFLDEPLPTIKMVHAAQHEASNARDSTDGKVIKFPAKKSD